MDKRVPETLSSMERVAEAAEALALDIVIRTMDQSTRTAQDAADACGCAVGQIVKSLVFQDDAGGLVLLLVSGAHDADLALMARDGLVLSRCDARRVREETGFAIGGVAPIGHLSPLPVHMDAALLDHGTVWCAAGRPDSVFAVDPARLREATGASVVKVTADG